jgi:threonine dehydrogenase-like Zn-dependent dehydrogenase
MRDERNAMTKTMTAIWLEESGIRLRRDLAVPEPPPGETLVRVLLAGICRTDLELVRGYYPWIGVLGHEFVGIVERGPEDLLGRRVVGEINAVCRQCVTCRAGRPTHCERRTVLGIIGRDGAFAHYLTLPVENLHLVPDSVSDEAATFVEPLAAALEVGEQVSVRPSERVLVVGDGKLGQLIARVLALSGIDLAVLGRHPRKLEMLERLGIPTLLPDAVVEARYDLVVECAGNDSGFATALDAVRPRGTLVMKSTYAGRLTLDASRIVVDEITVVGSRCGPFAPALRLLSEGRVAVDELIDQRYPLERGLEAFAAAETKGTLKVLIAPDGAPEA